MKKTLLVMSCVLAIGLSGNAFGATHAYLSAAIQENDLSAVKEALRLAGPLHQKDKNEHLDQAHILVMRTKNLSMSLWDWTKFFTGTSMATIPFWLTVAAAGVALKTNSRREQEEALRYGAICAACCTPGLAFMISGYRCNADRKLWYSALNIEKAIKNAPVKA